MVNDIILLGRRVNDIQVGDVADVIERREVGVLESIIIVVCRSGGIGRHAWFRSMCPLRA